MSKDNNYFQIVKIAWILTMILMMLALAMPALGAPELQATNTPTPTETPTPTPEVATKHQLSTGRYIVVERSFSYGQIAIVLSVMLLTLAAVIYIIWDIIKGYIY